MGSNRSGSRVISIGNYVIVLLTSDGIVEHGDDDDDDLNVTGAIKMSGFVRSSLILLVSIGIAPVAKVEAYCFGAGKNPSFTGPPKVEQIDLRTVKVSWSGLVQQAECADQFLVKYWEKAQGPNKFKTTELLKTDKFSIDIEVTPRVLYRFQAVAREDKGAILGIDWNRSPERDFKTSQHNKEVEPTSSAATEDDDNYQLNAADKDIITPNVVENQDQNPIFTLTVWKIGIIVVCGVVFLLIIVGVVYKFACSKKSEDSDIEEDDEDEDDDEFLEKEKFEA